MGKEAIEVKRELVKKPVTAAFTELSNEAIGKATRLKIKTAIEEQNRKPPMTKISS